MSKNQKKQDKGGILGLGILSGNRPKLLKQSEPVTADVPGSNKYNFCRLSAAIIEDERKASTVDYDALATALYQLKDQIPPELTPQLLRDHQLLMGIRQQEATHLKINEEINHRWCGKSSYWAGYVGKHKLDDQT